VFFPQKKHVDEMSLFDLGGAGVFPFGGDGGRGDDLS